MSRPVKTPQQIMAHFQDMLTTSFNTLHGTVIPADAPPAQLASMHFAFLAGMTAFKLAIDTVAAVPDDDLGAACLQLLHEDYGRIRDHIMEGDGLMGVPVASQAKH